MLRADNQSMDADTKTDFMIYYFIKVSLSRSVHPAWPVGARVRLWWKTHNQMVVATGHDDIARVEHMSVESSYAYKYA